jgi:hypothetical protein
VCHAVSMSSKCWHLCAALQVFVTTTALSAELCWMSCKCSHHRTAPDVLQVLASFLLCSPQVFLTTTAPCAALCWMSCKCSLLRAAPQVVVRTRHRVPRCAGSLASARFFAPHSRFCHRNTLCRAVLDVLQVLASSRSTGRFHHSDTLCRAVLDVLQMLASSRSTGPFCQRKAPHAECVRTTPSRMCQNHSVHSQTKMLRLCLNVS